MNNAHFPHTLINPSTSLGAGAEAGGATHGWHNKVLCHCRPTRIYAENVIFTKHIIA